jgi:fengycin family lipopeptide synthetase D
MDKELWEYVGKRAADDIEAGGWLSSYTGKPLSAAEMDEYGENALQKLLPLLHPRMRVLEIGCASGLTMYRAAPHVGYYLGTDFSNTIIERNRERVQQEGHQNIALQCLAAHEIDILKQQEEPFDLVIMNSVIQAFHGHNYFRQVMRKSIELLGDKGFLFIGDIMDQDLKDDLVRDLIRFQRANRGKENHYKTRTNFSQELFIAREFFRDLEVDMPVIREVEFSSKIHTIENELTKFRYDALITINKQKRNPGFTTLATKHKYQEDLRVLEGYGTEPPAAKVTPGNLAYVIYTSGSTGKPKGVLVQHGGVFNAIYWRRQEYNLTPDDGVLQLFSFSFDGFVTSFFTPIVSGSRVVLPTDEEARDVFRIKELIVSRRITHFICVPSLYASLLEICTSGELSRLRLVTLAGEAVKPFLVEKSKHLDPRLELVNEYGPTESTVVATIYRNLQGVSVITIGKPVANIQISILDRYDHLVPAGIAGELCITGTGIARGYMNRPELTAEKFLFISSSKIYKTGDMARWLPDGNIEFMGRVDHQVKIRGYRIEPGEIESCLASRPEVKEAVVADRVDNMENRYLCAYVVPHSSHLTDSPGGETFETAELKNYLSGKLPAYMVPRYFVKIDEVPLTANGKVDRKALPEPGFERGGVHDEYEPPTNEVEEKMVEIWQDVLGIHQPGISDNFFEIGGDSINAIQVTARMRKYGLELKISDLFLNPTIKESAKCVAIHREKAEGEPSSAPGGLEYSRLKKEELEEYEEEFSDLD